MNNPNPYKSPEELGSSRKNGRPWWDPEIPLPRNPLVIVGIIVFLVLLIAMMLPAVN